MKRIQWLALLLLFTGTVFGQADLVIVNANVVTMNRSLPKAEAIAIAGDRIISVGNNSEITGLAAPNARLIDARGRL
ncbi:hypothetical protein OFC13_30375, partial [Escherichia coli]|nr:hypothetical protein [Escherichia coli]